MKMFPFLLWICASSLSLFAASPEEIEGLVRNLGADDFRVRNQSEADLLAIGGEAQPFLVPHQDSKDPEVRERVQRILKKLPPDIVSFLKELKTCAGEAREGDTVWPCVFTVKSYNPETGEFTGTLEWTSLNALHAIEGTFKDNILTFTETEFITKGNAVLDVSYTFKLTDSKNGTLFGEWSSKDNRKGPAELHINPETKAESVKEKDPHVIHRNNIFGGGDPFGF
jgi:hypothetical protein